MLMELTNDERAVLHALEIAKLGKRTTQQLMRDTHAPQERVQAALQSLMGKKLVAHVGISKYFTLTLAAKNMEVVDRVIREAEATQPKTLEERVAELEKQVAALLAANPEAHMPELCQRHQCSYYMHYLSYGPAELQHEGFHAAEKRCEELQLRAQRWLDEHKGQPNLQFPDGLDKLCRAAEARVRA